MQLSPALVIVVMLMVLSSKNRLFAVPAGEGGGDGFTLPRYRNAEILPEEEEKVLWSTTP